MLTCETITGPAHWASALVNGDYSGLTTQDCAQLSAWLKRTGVKNICGIADDSERFTWSLRVHAPECDADGGTVCDYQYLESAPLKRLPRIVASEHTNATDKLVPFGERWNLVNKWARLELVSYETSEHERNESAKDSVPPTSYRNLVRIRIGLANGAPRDTDYGEESFRAIY